ncbi:glycine zipper 2TM domain-containing protein [Tahibacter amnicola]|uniref:Glycine zipper 2TM domain-containing protein n=1 Tax=Tahibacter amnicola TaxID=2976241 RepID=A0ABY6BDI1_9GAMM|nr:glycine zipper 2TM domain-containing protein [Tahibacter amnicola]UXI67288.1 glycine zipper 2TM domain-containing protein [Tahibacter amnicola]
MKSIRSTLVLAAGLALASPAFAYQRADYYGPRYDWATVVDVDPIIERSRYPVSREVCYDEPVTRYHSGHVSRRDTTGPTILGAVVGGALGNQVGKGDGRKAATIAGAVIGGSIGHESARRRGDYHETRGYYTQDYETRCRRQTNYRANREVVGYRVTYRYHGDIYHTTMDHHPGNRLRVRVNGSVVPAE